MLTISQLASHAGVTVRAVRHYHQIGLLEEPERNRSGYRVYDAGAVVRLIRIRTLADAGVPLARVRELLEAGPEEFGLAIDQIDRGLREEITQLKETRRRIARLGSGDQLTLPSSVVDFLDRLRGLGVDERYVAMERDGWIMLAAKAPDQIDAIIAAKHRELADPDMLALYRVLGEAVAWAADDPRVVEVADLLERLMTRALESNEPFVDDGLDAPSLDLMDSAALNSAPAAEALFTILQERGWSGWTRIERRTRANP